MAKLKKKESKRGNDSSTPSYAKRKGKEKAKAVKFVDKIKQSEIKNEIAGLSTFLSQGGMMLRLVHDDGDCVFRSVSHQIYGTEKYHLCIRERAVARMQAYSSYYRPFISDDQSFSEYCSLMSEAGTYASHIELQAVADVYKVHVLVHSKVNDRFVRPIRIYSNTCTALDELFIQHPELAVHKSIEYGSGNDGLDNNNDNTDNDNNNNNNDNNNNNNNNNDNNDNNNKNGNNGDGKGGKDTESNRNNRNNTNKEGNQYNSTNANDHVQVRALEGWNLSIAAERRKKQRELEAQGRVLHIACYKDVHFHSTQAECDNDRRTSHSNSKTNTNEGHKTHSVSGDYQQRGSGGVNVKGEAMREGEEETVPSPCDWNGPCAIQRSILEAGRKNNNEDSMLWRFSAGQSIAAFAVVLVSFTSLLSALSLV